MPTKRVSQPRLEDRKRRAAGVLRRLRRDYGQAECALQFANPLQLLIATILSAQCTDERVNKVTTQLFRNYRTASDFAAVSQAELEAAIRSTGFFRNKAKSIRGCCEALVRDHQGEVPHDLETLVQLPGVGRKTANVVLGTAYRVASGVVVDTHVSRLSRRMGLTKHSDPVKIEQDLIAVLPRKEWIAFSHRMILHGRQVCQARRPACESCGMTDICPKLGVPTRRAT